MPRCGRGVVRHGVPISACGRGEEWQFALASGRMPGCVSRALCFVTYLCGIVCVLFEYWLMMIHGFIFYFLCGFVVVLELLRLLNARPLSLLGVALDIFFV